MPIWKEDARATSPGSTLSTCTLHCAAVELIPLEEAAFSADSCSGCAMLIVTTATATTNSETRLLAFTWNLRIALFYGLVRALADMCAVGHQFVPENFRLSFVELKNGTVHSAIRVNVLQGKSVVLLVSKKANSAAAAERNRSLT